MLKHYILDGHKAIEASDLFDWCRWFEAADRVVKKTEISGVEISTVFLGLDHNFGLFGSPLVFETLVFGGELNGQCERYATWEDAERGHEEMCNKVRTP